LKNKILEYIMLVELAIVQVIGFVENEHWFSMLNFMKTKLWLTMNLELVVHMLSQKFFILQNFPFGVAIKNWKDNKFWYGAKSWHLNYYKLASCFFICILPNIYLLFIYDICLTFEFLDNK
jgi:hypothetical protein